MMVFYLCFVALFGKSQLVSITEINALKDLYNATNGRSWIDNEYWLIGDPCVKPWHGVSCSGTFVQQLNLQFNQLSGTIPPSIGNLTSLIELNLGNNKLSGTIPESIRNLTSLTYLHLGGNQLSGTIPPSIGYLTSLINLHLGGNQLSGTIPLSIWNLTSLTQLFLFSNQLSGTITPSIGNLTLLVILNLGTNQLSGTIPPSIDNLTSLTQLHLDTNQLSGTIPPSIGNLTSISDLKLNANQLNGTITPSIGSLTLLISLVLSNNQLSGTIPPSIGNLNSLTQLYLSTNLLSGTIPPSIGHLTTLAILNLGTNQLNGNIPLSIGNLISLTELDLQNTELQLCECEYLPPKLKICNLNGITYPCNCSIPSGCSVLACNTFTCLPGIIPQPSSDVGIIPQHLDTSCQGNYETQFTCNNTKWTSRNIILELNGTNLMNSFFNISSVFINENVSITDSYVNIKNNIFINKNSALTVKNSNIFVEGDFYVNNESTIIFDETDNFTNINIKHCAFLSGSLIVTTAYNSHIGKSLPILNYQCLNGTFSSIYFNLTDKPQCNVMPHPKYNSTSLIIFFDIPNQCSSEVPWINIILGIIGFLFLIIFIVSVFAMLRMRKKRNKNIDKLDKLAQNGNLKITL